jgi:protein ImuB
LALLVGPQRLEIPGWTDAGSEPGDEGRVAVPVLRDYFIARSAQAGLLWIYRERKPRAQTAWFLHGIFA